MLITASHHVLFAQDATTPPEWVHLVPAGTFSGVDGRGPFKLANPQAVITASMAGGALLIDESHATDLAPKTGVPAPARAWITEMQARADGLWGRAAWSDTGKQLMSERAYRGLSPVFQHTKDGVVARVLRAALTNTPNLLLTSLNSQQETDMDVAALRKALGLPETADEAAILAAITANAGAVAAHSRQLAAIAGAAGLEPNLAADALVTALQARQAAGNPADLANQVVTLQTQLGTVQAERAREKAVAFVDAAIKAGKPIVSLRDHYIARHVANAVEVEKEVNALVSINVGGMPAVALNTAGQPDPDAPTAHEKAVAEKMGIDPKKLAEQRKKREASGSGGGNG